MRCRVRSDPRRGCARQSLLPLNSFLQLLGQGKAVRYGNQQIDVEHLLSALLEQEGGLASSILARAGVNVEALSKKLTGELERLPKVSGGASVIDQIYVTPRLNKLLTAASTSLELSPKLEFDAARSARTGRAGI